MVEPISDPALITYDGSDEAKRALAYARKLLRVEKVYIPTVNCSPLVGLRNQLSTSGEQLSLRARSSLSEQQRE